MDSDHRPAGAGWLRKHALMLAILCLGLVYSHHGMLLSEFRLTPGDPSDAYLVNFLLEHDYLWATQQPSHQRYWDTPMFYPHPNTTAYTETLLGGLPFYAPWRLLGIPPDTSFQLWFLVISILNYLSCYFLLRNLMGAGELASNAGAFLFAFASARIIQEWHPQLAPAFYIVLAFAGAWLFFDNRRPRRPWIAAALFVGGAVAEVYTSVYMAWYFVFACSIAAVVAACHPSYRASFFSRLRQDWAKLAVAAAVGAVVAWPLLMHSRAVALEIGLRNYDFVRALLPGFPSFLKQSRDSWVYGWLDPHIRLPQNPVFWEESFGLGIVTTVLVLWSLVTDRRPAWRLLAAVCGLLFLLTIRLPNGLSLWKFVYLTFPGAGALRAVGRVGLFLLFPAAIAFAAALDRISLRFSPLAAAVCGLVMVAEQGVSPNVYAKENLRGMVDNVASQAPPDCQAFLFSPPNDNQWTPVLAHSVALWAQIATAIPTVNASSGAIPRQWRFEDTRIGSDADYSKLKQALLHWQREHPSLGEVCWLKPSDDRSAAAISRAARGRPKLAVERVSRDGATSLSGSSVK